MAQNSKDVLFKSKVNNYISQKLSQSETPPVFSVTDDGYGTYTVGKSNGDVTLTYDGQNETYTFTPNIGDAVSVLASNVSSIVVDFITLNADAQILDSKYITGSGIVNVSSYSGNPDLNYTAPAVVMADILGTTAGEPFYLYPDDLGSPSTGRIVSVMEGEVMLKEDLYPLKDLNTSISVDQDATFILNAKQAEDADVSGEGSSVVLGTIAEESTSISVNTKGTNHITGGKGADAIELGKGTDILYYSFGDEYYESDSTTTKYDAVKNFSVDTDKISPLSRAGISISVASSLERFEDIDGSSITSEQELIDGVLKSTNFSDLGANEAGITVVDSGDYAGAYLYANDSVAELDESKDLFIKMLDTSGLGAVGTLSVGDYFLEAEEVFKVKVEDDIITFTATAAGDISLSIDNNIATFTKGSVTATTTVELSETTKIYLLRDQTIVDSVEDLNGITIEGEGSVHLSGSDGDQVLHISTQGPNLIQAGAGADRIYLLEELGPDTIIIASGDSTSSATDKIDNFDISMYGDTLMLPSTTIAGDAASLGSGDPLEDVTVGQVIIGEMAISNGIVTFKDASGTAGVVIDSTDALSAATTYLSNQIADGETVAFGYDIDSVAGTYLFQANASEDIVIELVGTTVFDLGADVSISELL
ncbi:hypothetical protein M947_07515 [Sulfurimonas hongkongensis]|uniref:Uncharacterized protein n=1 Tax=Sulfurimonas hongkongensis TaxID=1172190 RepID=T0L0J1_9BACT|nr:bluetail domain-containing putative surface protein [Sulfurimonas hongkongensis]EQB39298.1 hypothetical protein M947_07515 [Sulfurimonas hongkongensis]